MTGRDHIFCGNVVSETTAEIAPPSPLPHCDGKGWLPRLQDLRKNTCEFCGGRGFRIPKKTWVKPTGRR
jgi:hypothetical protein